MSYVPPATIDVVEKGKTPATAPGFFIGSGKYVDKKYRLFIHLVMI